MGLKFPTSVYAKFAAASWMDNQTQMSAFVRFRFDTITAGADQFIFRHRDGSTGDQFSLRKEATAGRLKASVTRNGIFVTEESIGVVLVAGTIYDAAMAWKVATATDGLKLWLNGTQEIASTSGQSGSYATGAGGGSGTLMIAAENNVSPQNFGIVTIEKLLIHPGVWWTQAVVDLLRKPFWPHQIGLRTPGAFYPMFGNVVDRIQDFSGNGRHIESNGIFGAGSGSSVGDIWNGTFDVAPVDAQGQYYFENQHLTDKWIPDRYVLLSPGRLEVTFVITSDLNDERTELGLRSPLTTAHIHRREPMDATRYYDWGLEIPSNWSANSNKTVVWQFYESAWNDGVHPVTAPPISCQLWGDNRFRIVLDLSSIGLRQELASIANVIGQTHTFSAKVRWANDTTGCFELRHNGVVVFSNPAMRTVNWEQEPGTTQGGIFFKLGLYLPGQNNNSGFTTYPNGFTRKIILNYLKVSTQPLTGTQGGLLGNAGLGPQNLLGQLAPPRRVHGALSTAVSGTVPPGVNPWAPCTGDAASGLPPDILHPNAAFTKTGLTNGVIYEFKVVAIDSGGLVGPDSNIVAVTPTVPAPSVSVLLASPWRRDRRFSKFRASQQ